MKFQRPRRTLFALLALLALTTITATPHQSLLPRARAQQYSNNIILNPGFEEGLGANGYPLYWINWTKHGGPDCSATPACISLDTSQYVTGATSAKLDLGQLDIGFISIAQSLPRSLTFRNLTDSPAGLDMWFYYLPKYAGAGDVRIRVLFGENVGELDYVFDPDPSLGYPNSTATVFLANGTQVPGGTKNIFMYGYPEGHWHHVRRNLRSDWAAPLKLANGTFVRGFSLDIPFPIIQFDALGFRSGGNYYSETAWIDDFTVCADSQTPLILSCDAPPPPANHWINFTARDLDRNDITSKVKWKLFNNIDQEVPYSMGEHILPVNYTYTLKIYYPTDIGQAPEPYLIHQAVVPLDSLSFIDLPLKSQSPSSSSYIAFNNPITSATINNYSTSILTFTAFGSSDISYTIVVDVARPPVLVVAQDLPTSFFYDAARNVTTIRTDTLGEFTIFFETPLQIPQLKFTDLSHRPIQIGTVQVKILNSQGAEIDYQPGKVLPDDAYYLQVDFKGKQIRRERLFGGTSPITLPMIRLETVPESYLAFNITATYTSLSESSSQINIIIDGTGPVLIIVELPSRPIYVQRNGQRIVTWSYNDESKTLEVSSTIDGTFTIVVKAGPVATFSRDPASPRVNQQVTFDASASYDPDGRILTYSWDFGDGGTGSGMAVTHAYFAMGAYTVRVNVTDNEGTPSSYSQKITVTAGEPSAPTSLQVNSGTDRITLTWSAPLWNGGSSVIRYRIYRGLSSSSLTLIAEIQAATTYTDRTALPWETYYYQISGLNEAGVEGELSAVASAQLNRGSGSILSNPPLLAAIGGGIGAVTILGTLIFLRGRRKTGNIPKQKHFPAVD